MQITHKGTTFEICHLKRIEALWIVWMEWIE